MLHHAVTSFTSRFYNSLLIDEQSEALFFFFFCSRYRFSYFRFSLFDNGTVYFESSDTAKRILRKAVESPFQRARYADNTNDFYSMSRSRANDPFTLGVSKFQEIPGTSRYIADAREFHVRRISWSALTHTYARARVRLVARVSVSRRSLSVRAFALSIDSILAWFPRFGDAWNKRVDKNYTFRLDAFRYGLVLYFKIAVTAKRREKFSGTVSDLYSTGISSFCK